MLEKFLIELGLSEKEAAVYMVLLESEHLSVADVSKKAKVNRTTVYPVLEYLMSKNLVREVEIKGKTKFKAESPERLETYITQQKLRINELESRVHDMIPQFKSVMHRDGDRPIVEFYEGRDSIFNASLESEKKMNEGDVIYTIYPRDLVEGNFSQKELNRLREARIAKKVRTKAIYTYSKGEYNPDTTGDRIKISNKNKILAEINVKGDIINIFTLGGSQNSIFIKSKDAAVTLETLFKLAIRGAQEENKE